ncbi:hypothetical protein [Pseudoalteromonas sp. MMG005]|nr:hypothetical protein [Pseudoalteromonas sp. MMG005]
MPEDIDMVIEGRIIILGEYPARLGVNPITIDLISRESITSLTGA